jgi:hypothetical protein
MRKIYLLEHWVLTLLLAPFTLMAIESVFGSNPNEVVGLLEIYPITLLFSIAFSLPTFLIYLTCFYFLSTYNVKWKIAKLVLITVPVVGIPITLTILGGSMTPEFIIPYCVTTIIVGLLLNLKSANQKPETSLPI